MSAVPSSRYPKAMGKLHDMAHAKLGSGKRFAAVEASAAAHGAKNPAAIAAMVGRKKYGAGKMQAMAAAGKRRADR